MSDLNAATLLPDADIVDTAIVPIRKGGVAGLFKITLAKLKAYVLGTSYLVPPGGTTGQVLKKASGTDGDIGWGADNVGSGGSTTLNGLTDVAIVTPTNGQVMTFDAASGKWKNAASTGGGGGGTATQISARYWGLFEVQPTIGQALVVGRAGFRTVSGGAATVPTTATGSAGAPLGAFNNTANWDTGTSSHDEFALCDFGAAFAPVEFYLTSRTDYGLGYQQMPRSLVLAYSSDGARWTEHSRYYMNFTAIGQTFSFAIPTVVTGSVGTITRPNVVQSIGAISTTANLPAAPTAGNLLVAIATHWDNAAATASGWNTVYRTNGASFDGMMILTKIVVQGDTAAQTPVTGSPSGCNLALFEVANHFGHMIVPANALQEQVGTSKSLGWGAGQNTSLLIGAASTISANTAPSSIVGATAIATVQGTSGSASPRQVTTFSAPVEAGGGTVTANYAASATQYIGLAVIAPKLSVP